jgi:hypothetical protein
MVRARPPRLHHARFISRPARPTSHADDEGLWLLLPMLDALAPGELADASALLVPASALLHPDGRQPDAQLHALLSAWPFRHPGRPSIMFLCDLAEVLDLHGHTWTSSEVSWIPIGFELIALGSVSNSVTAIHSYGSG